MLCESSLYCSIRSVMFNNVTENFPEFYMNNEEKLTHLLMYKWKHVSDFLDKLEQNIV